MDNKLSVTEKMVLGIVTIIIAIGFFLFYNDPAKFELYVQEDGIIEWLTVLGLVVSSVVCFYRFIILFFKKSKWFLFVTLVFGLFLFFAAGEEISWGQRIFGITSPGYFQRHNAQHETNLHNLVVGGVKLNMLIFSFLLVMMFGIYLVLVPVLYKKNLSVKKILDSSGLPVPQLYQVLSFIIVFGLVAFIKHGKNAELLECAGAFLFFLIVRYSKNREIFTAG